MHNCLQHPIFAIISEIAAESGNPAYVIGGYVRDALLNRPSKDIDIVVVGNGIGVAKKTAARLGKNTHVTVFKNFNTAMIKFGEEDIEFVGARKESYRRDSRKPIVEDGTLKDDQDRRDFTMNALAFDLTPENFGTLIDPFNGVKDLNDKIIRTPLDPDITFSDDPLRMIRAIRFATQLDFTIEPETFEAIHRNRERINIVSGERIIDEINKIMAAPVPSIGFKLLAKSGILEIILPELHSLQRTEVKKGMGHKNNFLHSLKVLDNVSRNSENIWLRWAALLHDIGKPAVKRFHPKHGWTFHGHDYIGQKMVPDLFRKLKLPMNEKMKYVQKMVSLHMRPIVLSQETVTDSAVRRLLFDAGEDIDDLMILCEADITSQIQENIRRYMANFQLVRQKLREIEEKDAVRVFQPPIDGNEIIQIFGLSPCREIGILKNAIKEAILDGIIPNNYQDAMTFLLERAAGMGLKPVQ